MTILKSCAAWLFLALVTVLVVLADCLSSRDEWEGGAE